MASCLFCLMCSCASVQYLDRGINVGGFDSEGNLTVYPQEIRKLLNKYDYRITYVGPENLDFIDQKKKFYFAVHDPGSPNSFLIELRQKGAGLYASKWNLLNMCLCDCNDPEVFSFDEKGEFNGCNLGTHVVSAIW